MAKLNIVYMLFRRSYLSEITMRNLAKCKDLDFKVILTGHPSVNIEPQAELARELGLNHEKKLIIRMLRMIGGGVLWPSILL